MRKKIKSSSKGEGAIKRLWQKPLYKTIVIAVPILAIVAGVLLYVFLPRYDMTIGNATVESTLSENGIKKVTASLDIDCNISMVDDMLTCADVDITGDYSSNKEVSAVIEGELTNAKTDNGQIAFISKKISIKPVVVRAEPYSNKMANVYKIIIKNDTENKDVLEYSLTVNTKFSEKDLSLINKIPTGYEVANALKTISTVDGTCVVTEDNDPNGNLNKTGGYIAAVYFSDNRANLEMKNNPYSDYKDICDQGTVAGGQIEVYANKEDAQKRADYLGAFNGGILSSGDSSAFGTSVFRISDEMTATQMKDLQEKVINALTK